MSINEEYVQALTDLGLTHMQAKVYIALLLLKDANARKIQQLSKLARQDVYPVLSELGEKGLVEKIVAKPTRFRPIPPDKTILILLQRRNEMMRQFGEKAAQMFNNFKYDCVETSILPGKPKFILLSKSETSPSGHIDKPGKAVNNAKKTMMGLITLSLFMKVQLMDEDIWKKAVKRGVKLKFIIARRGNEKLELNLDPVLENNDNFEIRWTTSIPTATVLLVDDKEAFCRVGTKLENPVLWSSSPQFVGMIKDYLKLKWKSLEHSGKQMISSKT